MLISVPLVFEYEAMLTRPEQLKGTGLTVGEVNSILDAVAAVAEPMTCRFLWRPHLEDPVKRTGRGKSPVLGDEIE
jgi:hypothetical protein